MRMRFKHESTIEKFSVGSISSNPPGVISRDDMDVLKEYFVNGINIDPSDIKQRKEKIPQEEGYRRFSIGTKDGSIQMRMRVYTRNQMVITLPGYKSSGIECEIEYDKDIPQETVTSLKDKVLEMYRLRN